MRGARRAWLENKGQRESRERLEDNAIIRNYRVRPRFAELSHSVSITGAVASLRPPPVDMVHKSNLARGCIDVRRPSSAARSRGELSHQ